MTRGGPGWLVAAASLACACDARAALDDDAPSVIMVAPPRLEAYRDVALVRDGLGWVVLYAYYEYRSERTGIWAVRPGQSPRRITDTIGALSASESDRGILVCWSSQCSSTPVPPSECGLLRQDLTLAEPPVEEPYGRVLALPTLGGHLYALSTDERCAEQLTPIDATGRPTGPSAPMEVRCDPPWWTQGPDTTDDSLACINSSERDCASEHYTGDPCRNLLQTVKASGVASAPLDAAPFGVPGRRIVMLGLAARPDGYLVAWDHTAQPISASLELEPQLDFVGDGLVDVAAIPTGYAIFTGADTGGWLQFQRFTPGGEPDDVAPMPLDPSPIDPGAPDPDAQFPFGYRPHVASSRDRWAVVWYAENDVPGDPQSTLLFRDFSPR